MFGSTIWTITRLVFQVAGQSTLYQKRSVSASRRGRCRARGCDPTDDLRLRARELALAAPCAAAPGRWFPISDSSRKGGTCGARRNTRRASALRNRFLMPSTGMDQPARRPIPTCSWRSTISLGALFAPADPPPSSRHAHKLFTRIRASHQAPLCRSGFRRRGSGIRSRNLATLPPEALSRRHGSTCTEWSSNLLASFGPRCAPSESANVVGHERPLSARLPTTAAFEDYTHFRTKNFAIDSVARRAPTPQRRARTEKTAPCTPAGQALNGARTALIGAKMSAF